MNYLDILQWVVIGGFFVSGYFALVYYQRFKSTVIEEQALFNANQLSESPVLEKKAMLTGNEREFYGRVKKAADALRLRVHSQVSMGAIVTPLIDESSPEYHAVRQQYAMKIIDYVLELKGDPVLVIELDDKMHDRAKDKKRDTLLLNAGIKTLRYESTDKPDVDKLITDILAAIASELKAAG